MRQAPLQLLAIRVDLHRLAVPGREHEIAELGIHPGQLSRSISANDQTVRIDVDVEPGPFDKSLHDPPAAGSPRLPDEEERDVVRDHRRHHPRRQDGRDGIGDTTGPWRAGGGFGDRRPGTARFSDEDVRQFRSEARQWTTEAEQLRRMLQGQKLNARELDDVLRGLRALQDDRVYQNVGELARLQSAVTESMKRFEYTLRRRAEGNDQVLLSGSDDVPEQFRKLVDQYYKALSKGPEKK